MMGRTSKFSFPMPGRKHTTSKDGAPPTPSSDPGNNLSKAQRILGTGNNLNIDSPIREEEHSWRHPSSRSSGMSISISESTISTNDNGSLHEVEQWDHESGVLPRNQRLRGKASSTLLGQRYGEDGTTSKSDLSGRLRNEDSSSTLKSYYDRQKSPLSISQQTSASSARDLALRKGFPPVIHRSPLLQVESSIDPFDVHFATSNTYNKENDFETSRSPDKASRKKPARLDLTKLFPRSRRHGDKMSDSESVTPSPSSVSTNASRNTGSMTSESGRRKLKKSRSKESIQSHQYSIRSNRSQEQRQTNGTLLQLYDHYEHLPVRSPRMGQIPETRVPDRVSMIARKDGNHLMAETMARSGKVQEPPLSSSENGSFSWKNVRSSMVPSPWESSSNASISSRNTRNSRNTSGSVLSHSDLKEKSVLSLSSDSEEGSDLEPAIPHHTSSSNSKASRVLNGSTSPVKERRRQSSQQPGGSGVTARGHGQGKSPPQETPFLTVPERSPASSGLSGPWTPPTNESSSPSHYHNDNRRSTQREKRSSRKVLSIASERSLQQPTPPLSPSSMIFRQTSERSSRFMAVTQQEEALLEALRQKRARMREEIIEEHETTKSPPRIPERQASRYSRASSVSTVRGAGGPQEKQRILLYLDTPVYAAQAIDTAEPSPDLDDFLSFGSDEDSTPRTSWVPPRRGQPRPDSFIAPHAKEEKNFPMTPPSAARLSAVGASRGFRDERLVNPGLAAKKRNTGVRFVDDGGLTNGHDFLLDEDESALWRV